VRLEHLMLESTAVTALQESLFAVGFGVYQDKGSITKELLMDGNIFSKAFRNYVSTDVMEADVFRFANEKPLYVSSVVLSVNAFMKSKYSPSRSKIYRGRGIMSRIYEQAHILLVKEGVKLNPDKWNPGDVWTSTLSTIPSFDSIHELNAFIREGIGNGKLVPISLKKVKKNARVVYNKQSVDTVFPGFDKIVRPASPFNTGILIQTSNKDIAINIRSFSQHSVAGVTSELLVKNTSARHGKATPRPMIKKHNINQTSLGNFRKDAYDTEVMVDRIIRLWKDIGYTWSDSQIEKYWAVRVKDDEFVRSPAGYWRSIINALEIGAHLENHSGMADDFTQNIVKSAMSASSVSSDFIKIY